MNETRRSPAPTRSGLVLRRAGTRARRGVAWLAEWLTQLFPEWQPVRLDEAACRDLGMSSSELASYRAECLGLVPRTRRRVPAAADRLRERPRRRRAQR